MNIYVLIATIDEGIHRVPSILLPEQEGVRYVVSWQRRPTPSPSRDGGELAALSTEKALLLRPDVTVSVIEGRGLCRNRNNAIKTAIDLLDDPLEDAVFIIADDDEQLMPEAFSRIREAYSKNPRLDGALFRMRSSKDGCYFKTYPPKAVTYGKHPRSYYPSSLEMSFRTRVWQAGLRFNERFGLGSELLCAGEEEVLLTDITRKGLLVRILPEDICYTEPATTGNRALDDKKLRSKGAVYAYSHSLIWAFFRSWREALSLAVRSRRSPFPIFRNIWSGVKYIRS